LRKFNIDEAAEGVSTVHKSVSVKSFIEILPCFPLLPSTTLRVLSAKLNDEGGATISLKIVITRYVSLQDQEVI